MADEKTVEEYVAEGVAFVESRPSVAKDGDDHDCDCAYNDRCGGLDEGWCDHCDDCCNCNSCTYARYA